MEALDNVAKQLGNTRTVCKKYYRHPVPISLHQNQTFYKYMDANQDGLIECSLSADERP